MSLDWIDLLFVVTVVVLVFNGFRNGFVASLITLISIPLGFVIAIIFGPQVARMLASNGLSITPFLAYGALFFGTVLVVHIIATIIRGFVHKIPVIGFGDELAGAVVGFIEAWLLWVVLLVVLHNTLTTLQNVPGVDATQFSAWQQAYNDAVTHSLFAQVNSFIISSIPVPHGLLRIRPFL